MGVQPGGNADSQLHTAAASGWLDDEATSWQTVGLGTNATLREQPAWNGHESGVPSEPGNTPGQSAAAAGNGKGSIAAVTHQADTPQTAALAGDACRAHGNDADQHIAAGGAETSDAPQTPEDGDSSVAAVPDGTEGGPLDTNPAVAGTSEIEEGGRTIDNGLPSLEEDCPKLASAGARLINVVSVQHTTVKVEGDATSDPSTKAQRSEANASVSESQKAIQPVSFHPTPVPTAVSSPGPSEDVLPITAEHATGTVSTAAVTAPQIAQAMECPDPIATAEQRTAGDWMEGSTSATAAASGSKPRRLPAPLEVAEAEAELVDKVEGMQHNRLAAERDQREALDAGRAAEFGRERTARADSFAEEDRKLLAAEERRLAEIRREADLGRLQRGAEFEETEEALSGLVDRPPAPAVRKDGVAAGAAGTTGATPMPVRGMRPQHYTEQETLPDGIKNSLARPPDKVLDDMEMMEARAKAAGGGINLEAFERVEQRQRARQVERLEILHGQTEEEKSATMLRMAVRLQMFFRQKIAKMRVARLKHARSASKGKVRFGSSK